MSCPDCGGKGYFEDDYDAWDEKFKMCAICPARTPAPRKSGRFPKHYALPTEEFTACGTRRVYETGRGGQDEQNYRGPSSRFWSNVTCADCWKHKPILGQLSLFGD